MIIMIRAILFSSLLLLTLTACKKDQLSIIGTWELVEVYNDPGDGSGDFTAVESDKTIEFKTNGTVISNGSLCMPSTESNNPMEGTYNDTNKTIDSDQCTDQPLAIRYEITDGYLIISYPCIEACKAKFKKK